MYKCTNCTNIPSVAVYQPYQCTNCKSVPSVPIIQVYQIHQVTNCTRVPTVPQHLVYRGMFQSQKVQKLPNMANFGLENIQFMATSRFCGVARLPNVATLEWQKSSNSSICRLWQYLSSVIKLPNMANLEWQPSNSGYFKYLPTLAIPITSNQVAKYGKFGMTSIIQF